MAGETKQDVQLVIRASNLATRPLKDVGVEVKNLTAGIKAQTEAAKTGAVSAGELREQLDDLRRVTVDMAARMKDVAGYEAQTKAISGLEAKVEAARKKLADYNAKLKEGDQVTEAQGARQRKLQESFDKQTAALATARDRQAKLKASLEASGVSTDDLASATAQMGAISLQAKNGIDSLNDSLAAYQRNLKASQAAARELASTQETALRSAVGGARGLTPFNQRLSPGQELQARLQSGVDVRRQNDQNLFLDSQVQSAAAQRAADQAKAFRQTADEAINAARAVKQYRDETVQILTSGQSAANAVRALIDPAQEARSTLKGLQGQVKDLAGTVAAIDGPIQGFEKTLNGLLAAQRDIVGQSRLIDAYREQEAAGKAALAQYRDARRALRDLETQVKASVDADEDLLRATRAAANEVKTSARNFYDQAAAVQQARARLNELGIDTRQLDAAQAALTRTANQSATALTNLRGAYERYGRSTKGGDGIFGLRPYAVQNLGYQVNDFFTQIASGTSVTQAFSQQIGQVVQVFDGLAMTLVRLSPIIVPVAAAIGTLVAALGRVYQTEASARQFNAIILATTDGVNYQAEALTKLQRQIALTGPSFAEAGKMLQTFMRAGVEPARLEQFAQTATRLSKVFGVDLNTAATEVTKGLRGGMDALDELNEKYGFLDTNLRDNISRMMDQGKTAEALQMAHNRLSERLESAANQMKGPWSTAIQNFKNAWNELLDFIANSMVGRAALATINALVTGLNAITTAYGPAADQMGRVAKIIQLTRRREELTGKLDNSTPDEPGTRNVRNIAIQAEIDSVDKELAALRALAPAATTAADANREVTTTNNQMAISAARVAENLEEQIARNKRLATTEGRLAQARIDAQNALTAKGVTDFNLPESRRAIDAQVALVQNEIDKEREAEAKRKAAEARSAASRARAEENRRRSAAAALEGSLQSVQARGLRGNDTEEGRVAAVTEQYKRLYAQIDEFKRLGGTAIGGRSLDQFRAEVAAAEQLVAANERRKFQTEELGRKEQELNQAVQQRTALVQEISALEDQGAITSVQAQERIKSAYNSTSAGIRTIADELVAMATKAQSTGAITSVELEKIIATSQRIQAQTAYVNPELAKLQQTFSNSFVNNVSTGLEGVGTQLGSLATGAQSLNETFWGIGVTAANVFLGLAKDISLAIIKMYLLQAASESLGLSMGASGGAGGGGWLGKLLGIGVSAALGGSDGGITAALSGASIATENAGMSVINAGIYHDGTASVGAGGRRRMVSADMFREAPRYHDGTPSVGLAPGEQAAILEKGEQVISKRSNRNMLNREQSEQRGQTAILAVGDEQIAQATKGRAGEDVFLYHLKRNASTVRQYSKG